MTRTPLATRKLRQGRFFLERLQTQSGRSIRKDSIALESYLSAFLGAIQSAFYRLGKEVGKDTFRMKQKQWRSRLPQEDRKFFNWMTKQRDLDVHELPPTTTTKGKRYGVHSISNVQSSAPPGVDPGHVILYQHYLGSLEITNACEKYMSLMESLVQEFQNVKPGKKTGGERSRKLTNGL